MNQFLQIPLFQDAYFGDDLGPRHGGGNILNERFFIYGGDTMETRKVIQTLRECDPVKFLEQHAKQHPEISGTIERARETGFLEEAAEYIVNGLIEEMEQKKTNWRAIVDVEDSLQRAIGSVEAMRTYIAEYQNVKPDIKRRGSFLTETATQLTDQLQGLVKEMEG